MKLDFQEDGSWLWRFGDVPLGTALGAMDETSILQQIELLDPILKGLKLNLSCDVPEILETNLVREQSSRAYYTVNFDDQIAVPNLQERLTQYTKLLEPKFLRINGLPGPRVEPLATPKKPPGKAQN